MDGKIYVLTDGTIVKEEDLTPELRKELCLDDTEEEYEEEYPEEYESIDEFARGEGFWIDDDGHWIPIDDDDLFW